mgnify:CR=1 FL=1
MAYGFEGLIYSLQHWGVFDVILPFILIFTIVYAILEKTEILGKDAFTARKYAVVVALVLAFAVVVPHVTGMYYYGFDAVEIINNALPQVGLLLVAIVMMLLTIGLWTGKKPDGSKGVGVWFTLVSGIIVLAIFVASIGWWNVPSWLWRLLNSDVIALVIAILVFGIIIKFITGKEKSTEELKKKKSTAQQLEAFFGGEGDK